MTTVTTERDVITEILELYKELSCLWDTSSKNYNNKHVRKEALEFLLEKFKLIEPDATITTIKKRIENMRAAYKREWKKVQLSIQTGGRDVYVPTLWYYGYLAFLDEKDAHSSGVDTISNCDDDEENAASEEGVPTKRPAPPSPNSNRKFIKFETEDRRNELLSPSCNYQRVSSEEAEIYGKAWALEYKKLTPDQQIFAKKAINDILFEAQLGTLSRHSVVINGFHDSPTISRTPSSYSYGGTDFS